jgi:hypothetical protein
LLILQIKLFTPLNISIKMECQQCFEENKRSIAEKGYGYGYIGMRFNCIRHNKSNSSQTYQENNVENLNFPNNKKEGNFGGVRGLRSVRR